MPRDYKKEYAREKNKDYRNKDERIIFRVRRNLFEDFSAKCEMNGVSKTKVLTEFVESYVFDDKKDP